MRGGHRLPDEEPRDAQPADAYPTYKSFISTHLRGESDVSPLLAYTSQNRGGGGVRYFSEMDFMSLGALGFGGGAMVMLSCTCGAWRGKSVKDVQIHAGVS
jgi:hypothetical protein